MNLLNILTGPVFDIIGKLIPDKNAQAAAKLQILQMEQAGQFKEWEVQLEQDRIQLERDKAQADVNKTEAESPDLFKSGWRPAVGWVCVIGLIYSFLAQPILVWVSRINGWQEPPALDMATLYGLLFGLLGLGTMRTTERIAGVVSKSK